jgi:hypothetical protein
MEKKPERVWNPSMAPSNAMAKKADLVTASHQSASQPLLQELADHWFDVAADERDSRLQVSTALVSGLLPAWVKGTGDRLLGILAACLIPGCDVHFITETEKILRHVRQSESLPKEFWSARDCLASSGSDVVAILVFESGIRPLTLDGALRLGLVGSGPPEV